MPAGIPGANGNVWVITNDSRMYGPHLQGSNRAACQFADSGAGVSVAARGGYTRDRKALYGLLKPANAIEGSGVRYLPSDDVVPGLRTGVWRESVECPDGRLISRAKSDPKEVREEGKHGKDNPLPYDPTRRYRCSCEP